MGLSNCHDPDHDVLLLPDRFTAVTWAYGNDEQKEGMAYHDHDKRGSTALPLLAASPQAFSLLMAPPADLPDDTQTLTLRFKDVPLRANRSTNYWCMWVEVPADAKYHVYANHFLQDPRTDGLVHHSTVSQDDDTRERR